MLPLNYPYQNLVTEDMPGEEWRLIDGFEECYTISNLGRIKSLGRYVNYNFPSHTVLRWHPEKIRHQIKTKQWNGHLNKFYYILRVSFGIRVGAKRKNCTYTVHRLVYNAFVAPIDYKQDEKNIVHIDGDYNNNHVDNLRGEERSIIHQHSYQRGRRVNGFIGQDMKQLVAKGMPKRQKAVTQYDLKGKRIKAYKSLKEAELNTGTHHSAIALVAKGKIPQRSGFIWRYGKGPAKIDISFYLEAKAMVQKKICKVVTQYSLKGKKLKVYNSIREAGIKTGIGETVIQGAVRGVYHTAGGYQWQYGDGPDNINPMPPR
jgi:hypothetical protein